MRKLIIFVTILAIGAVIGPIVVGTRSFDGTVVEKPYERGLDWDRERASIKASGLTVDISNTVMMTGRSELVIHVRSRSGAIYNGPLILKLTRPDTARFDSFPKAETAGSGRFMAKVDIPKEGKWLLEAGLVSMGNRLTITRELHARKR